MTRSHTRSALAVAIALSFALPLSAARGAAQDPIREGPIAYVAHGAMFDADGDEIEPTPEFIARAQRFYRLELRRFAPPDVWRSAAALRRSVRDSAREAAVPSAAAGMMAEAAALDLLMDRSAPRGNDRLFGKLVTLEAHRSAQDRLARRPQLEDLRGVDWPKSVGPRPRLAPRIAPPDQRGSRAPGSPRPATRALAPLLPPLATNAQGQAYRDQCAAAGVPIPPDWGRPEWISQGELTSEFISANEEAEVFTWESDRPAGMCIALPRWNASDEAQFLGIICLSEEWSKACFWDNQTGGAQFFPERGEVYPFSAFGGGADLTYQPAGICTECHAGQNPFVIHPNTALGRPQLDGLPLFSERWYEPIVRADWPQNPGPMASAGACAGCHTDGGQGGGFPSISSAIAGYCNNVLGIAISQSMPPAPASRGSLENDPHPAALLALCDDPPPDDVVVVGGAPSATMTGVDSFGTASDVFVIRSNDGSRQTLWGTRQYADVTATADAYCQGLGMSVAASWRTDDCGEDESSYMRFNLDTAAWESRSSGSANNPPGQCLYPLLSEVTCAP